MAWLDTLGATTIATIRDAPGETIVPAVAEVHTTGGERAMAVLAQLARRAPGTSIQLVHGEVIGEGGMGIVRAAEQVALGRTVAVKTLKHRDPAAALGLLREAWVTGAIEHPNVVPVHYVELDDDGMPLVVLKRIEGVEWSQLIDDAAEVERRFGATDLVAWNLGILMQVLNALGAAHHRGMIHRDLKPSNVMIGDFGEVYLLDWGIAVSLRDDGSGRFPLASRATELAGTPCYMAPEMLCREGSPPQSERTDIYLAGSVLYELITGAPPHMGADVLTVIASVIASQPDLPASVPPELARICQRALDEHPAKRFESAQAMRLALQAYLEHRGSAELALRARARLDELVAMLATNSAGRDDLYRIFNACRFGFHEALAAWRDNTDAREGLTRATRALAEFELDAGQPAAALTLLADIEAPDLVVRATAAADARRREQAALEKLRALHDPTVGRRTRTVFALLLGLTFTVLPLLNGAFAVVHSSFHEVAWAGALAALILVGGVWARDSMTATLLNRRVFATGLFVFVMQAILAVGIGFLGFTVVVSEVVFLFLWAVVAGMVAITLDGWFAPCAIVYSIAFVIAASRPESRHYLMSGANLAFAINAVWRWRPATLIPTPEERARLMSRDPARR